MSRVAKIILVLPLISSLLFSSILCCCLLQSVEAANLDQHAQHAVHSSDCESHSTQNSRSGEERQCECPKLQSTLAKNIDIFKSADIVLSFLNQIVLTKAFLRIVPHNNLLIIEHSPPSANSNSPPIYIINSVLRI
jgi:hypothetical protein